ncbi:hypothetical protein [Tabrizicola sp.]|uniref:hypothetical protein n=1 Tax=Tabrizicola sp. TaxID=2005166 RepID=UPI001A4F4B08|nr:hypothetical protein [Tabrizicola sp.]MBL9072776.1 hypothetical protein [Tabrizicola sp.]
MLDVSVNCARSAWVSEYYVIGPQQIVVQDLADAIRAHDRVAVVRVFHRNEDLLAALAKTRPTAVILHREPAEFAGTALGRALAADGIPHGFLSADEGAGGPAILVSPFTEATVSAFLQGLLAGIPRADG